jgi:aldehyde:ferredoxin oxidoreductase
MSRILRLNMADQSYRWQEVPPDYAGLGGRALNSRLIRDEVDPTCHPLSAVNKLVVAPGLLTGTIAANSGRISVGGKSPLTGGIKESNAGGIVSQKLARLGIKAVVVEAKPQQNDGFYLVKISKDGVDFFPASEYEGLGNYRTMAQLWKRFGRSVGVMSIGQAGEKRLTTASIHFTDTHGRPGRAADRGGLGALMGSKKLKALVVDDRGAPSGVPLADPESFKAVARKWAKFIVEPSVSGQTLPTYGTAVLINIVNEAGALGANTLIKNLDEIAMIDRLCDDFGLDTLEMGLTLGVLMAGGAIPWGDGPAAIKMVKKVGKNDPWGLIIGNGSVFTGRALGVEWVPAVQGQSPPAYDPRAEKGVGLTYATSPMGGDQTADYGVAANLLKCGGEGDLLKKEGNVELSRNLQIATAAIDSTGLDPFVAFPVLDNPEALQCLVDLINARHGLNLTTGDVGTLGRRVLEDELSFNQDAGFTKAHDGLPACFKEHLKPHGAIWDFTDQEIDAVLGDL